MQVICGRLRAQPGAQTSVKYEYCSSGGWKAGVACIAEDGGSTEVIPLSEVRQMPYNLERTARAGVRTLATCGYDPTLRAHCLLLSIYLF